MILYLKALHIIFVVTWFAGLFYIVRLFIYHVEAMDRDEPARTILIEQFSLMQKRLWYGITWPSMILTLIFGTWLLIEMGNYTSNWIWVKLSLVSGLVVYHFACGRIFKKLMAGKSTYTSSGLRIWNEVATLFLVSIVFVVVLKSTSEYLTGIFSMIALGMLLAASIKIYAKYRK